MSLPTPDRGSDRPQVRRQVQRRVRPAAGALQGQRNGRDFFRLIGGFKERIGRKTFGRKEKLKLFL